MALSLKAWRRAKNYTQEEMANGLNVHVNTYINWENEPQKMSIRNAFRVCNMLDLEFNDVIFLPEDATEM